MTDFLDMYAVEIGGAAEHERRAEGEAAFAALADGTGRHEFTGLRCDHAGCTGSLLGKTDSRDDLHALTARAELAGWQCLFVKGESKHWCPQHVDPNRERIRGLK